VVALYQLRQELSFNLIHLVITIGIVVQDGLVLFVILVDGVELMLQQVVAIVMPVPMGSSVRSKQNPTQILVSVVH
jgi:hypothetical protein